MAARPRRRSASSNVPGVGARIARPLGCAVRGHSPTAAGPQSLRRGRPVWPPVFRVRLQQAVTRRRRFRAAIKAAPTATTEVRRYKRLFAATAPATRDRFAARADVGIGPYSVPPFLPENGQPPLGRNATQGRERVKKPPEAGKKPRRVSPPQRRNKIKIAISGDMRIGNRTLHPKRFDSFSKKTEDLLGCSPLCQKSVAFLTV